MKGINKVILVGNVGNDPDIRYANNGNMIANLSIATSERWRDKNSGEMQERTEWHRVTFFGRIAEVVNEYVRKGSKLYVEGRLQTRKWQAQDGSDRYSTEIVIDVGGTMQMLDSRPDRFNRDDGYSAPQNNYQQSNQSAPPATRSQQNAPPQSAPPATRSQQNAPPQSAPPATQQQSAPPPVHSDFNDDDIPF